MNKKFMNIKYLLLCLALVMLIGMFMKPVEVQAAEIVDSGNIDGMSWRFLDDGTLILGREGTEESISYKAERYQSSWQDFHRYFHSYYSSNNPTGAYVKKVKVEGIVHANGSLGYMFLNCDADEIDLRGLDTSAVTAMNYMFCDCQASVLNVSEFDVRAVKDMSYMFAFYSNLKELDLSNFYTPSLTDCHCMFSTSPFQSLDISKMDLTHVNPTGDGLSSMLFCGERQGYSFVSTLKKVVLGPNFVFGNKNDIYNSNKVALTANYNSNYRINGCYNLLGWRNKEINSKCYAGDSSYSYKYTLNDLAREYNPDMAGTWEWTYNTFNVRVHFDGGTGVSGSMADIVIEKPSDDNLWKIDLPKNAFAKPGYEFDHWESNIETTSDGTDSYTRQYSYSDEDFLYWRNYSDQKADWYTNNINITLHAVYRRRDTSVSMQDGAFEFTLRAGEEATFDDLPAGTSYQVYELTPEGWVLVKQKNSSGTIQAMTESKASFWNKYQPDIVSVQFTGTKTIDGQPAKKGSYSFELLDEDRNVIQTKKVLDGGFIQFDPIEYTKDDIGEHTYIVREINSGDDSIDYDVHEETIVVNVKDLHAADETVTVHSSTSNVNDYGTKLRDYESNKYYTDIVTIPGAEKLHVTVKYTNPRGNFWIWKGAHEGVHTQTYTADFNPSYDGSGGLIKNYVYQSGKNQEYLMDEFDVEGDSISVLYMSYAYDPSNGYYPNGPYSNMVNYGYYITVTADLPVTRIAADVTYDSDGIIFNNKTRPGSLRITKEATTLTDANKDDTFAFKIHFYNANGTPVEDGQIYWYIEGED